MIEGDPAAMTVIDPKTDTPVATIKAGEKLEYGAGDNHGAIYVAGVANGDLVKVDAKRNSVIAHWPAPGCTAPHGLAVDTRGHRVFMGCANSVMAVMDANSGRVVAMLPIGRGNDAVAWDSVRKRVFSSNGRDGTITVYQQQSPDNYAALATIHSVVSGRTMSVDSRDRTIVRRCGRYGSKSDARWPAAGQAGHGEADDLSAGRLTHQPPPRLVECQCSSFTPKTDIAIIRRLPV